VKKKVNSEKVTFRVQELSKTVRKMAAGSNNQNAAQAAMDAPAREANIRENARPYQPRTRQRIQEANPQNALPPPPAKYVPFCKPRYTTTWSLTTQIAQST